MKQWQRIGLIIGVAGLARLLIALNQPIILTADGSAYLFLADCLARGHWQAFYTERLPGYPLVLLALQSIIGQNIAHSGTTLTTSTEAWQQAIVLTQALMGIVTAVISAELARTLSGKLGGSPKVCEQLALYTGLMVALLPDNLFYERTILTESLFTLLFTTWAGLLVLQSGDIKTANKSWGLGVLAAAMIWTRPNALVLPLGLGVYNIIKKRWKALYTLCLPVLLAIGLWMGFNYQAHGLWLFASGGGQNQLYKVIDWLDTPTATAAIASGNQASKTKYQQALIIARQSYPASKTYEAVNDAHIRLYLAKKDRPNALPYWQVYYQHDQLAREIAAETIRKHPLAWLGQTGYQAWRLLSTATPWDAEALLWTLLVSLGSLGMLCMARQEGLKHVAILFWLIALQMLAFPVLTVCEARYRVPFEPVFGVFAMLCVFMLRHFCSKLRTS